MSEIAKITDKPSPIERKVIPFLNLQIEEIEEKTSLDKTSLLRALKFLENKEILKIKNESKEIVELDTNGIFYKKNHLPERRLLLYLESHSRVQMQEAAKESKLSDNEFKVSLGVLKSKALIELKDGKIILSASKEELTKKSLEEQLLEKLPIELEKISPKQKFALENLKKRKEIVKIELKTKISFELTELGKQLAGKTIKSDLIEEVTPEIIKTGIKNRRFREYDLQAQPPKIYGGRRHFVNQAIEYGRRIWLDMGFKEMSGTMTQTSFWNFDALFTAQDHPVREMQDTFFVSGIKGSLPKKQLIENIRKTHEEGIEKSKGWNYKWNEEESKKIILRTHTTCLSAQTLATLDLKKDLPAKFFSIGKVFRNETLDWSHGFEFYQSEGIVIDENVNFRHLLGYLKEFYRKMGFEKIRFSPTYFPYTEPSVEIHVFHEGRKVWLELGGAGIFRPEITVPILGKKIPVLAWGQGFDRIITDYYKIQDLREMYKNDLKQLREVKIWMK